MARITGKIEPKDKEGNSVDITARSEGNPKAFALIEPGFYNAVLTQLGFGTYQANLKGYPNPAQKDGKWTYGKLTPELTLQNENHTQIRKQDTVLGVLVDGVPTQPRGNGESPIWKEAQYLLSALGLFVTDGEGVFSLDFDPDLIRDRVIRVGIGIGGYVKGGEHKGNYNPKQITALLTEVNAGLPYEGWQIPQLVNLWNLENGYTNELDEEIEEGVSLKLKNYVTYYGGLSPKQAEEGGWFFDAETKAVFTTEQARDYYNSAKDMEVPANGEAAW